MRPRRRRANEEALHMIAVPATKVPAAKPKVVLRPKRSAKEPAPRPPKADTRLRLPTTSSAWNVLRPTSSATSLIIPLITPMS